MSGEMNNVATTYEAIVGKPQINGVTLVGNLDTTLLRISHEDITNNSDSNLHPINSIVGLQGELSNKASNESVNAQIREINESVDTRLEQVNTKIEEATRTYVFKQSIPSEEWLINHNLNKAPNVTVVDSAGSVVIGEVVYVDMDNITITFSGGFSGKALLN